jgi:branched-chain amino acid transport system permease protein
MEILIYGTINSVSLFLISVGFSFVYGISRIPNFAHGSLYCLTGFAVWFALNVLHLSYPVCIILGIGLTAIVGALIYRLVLIRVRGMPTSEIIASYAVGLAIMEALRCLGFKGMTYTIPQFFEGAIQVAGVPVSLHRIAVLFIGAVLFFAIWIFTHYTRIGLALRAIAQDERAALMLGIDSDKMALISMAIGSSLAAFSAIVLLPLGNIVVERGYSVLILSIAVCIIGGLGSLTGTVIAAFIIGFAQVLSIAYLGARFQMLVALVAIIISLMICPSGLFGKQKELEERV